MWKILTGIWLDLAQYWIDPFPLQRWFLTFIESCDLTKAARSISYIPTSQNKNATRTTIILETKYELPFRFIGIQYVYFSVKSLFSEYN